MKMSMIVQMAEKLFGIFNKKYFDGELPTPVISIHPEGRRFYGWCTTYKAWVDKDAGGYYEIAISGDHLDRPFDAVCGTLLHEMVHLYNLENGVKDTSRGNTYHNKKFKEEAEKRGLIIDRNPSIGWSLTTLQQETKDFVASLDMEFVGYRKKFGHNAVGVDDDGDGDGEEKPKKKSSSRKYVCPKCGIIVRATKEVNIKCGDCDEKMEVEQ